jgi:S-adenosylmethionine:tRNA ribosyltransferase-isomerase
MRRQDFYYELPPELIAQYPSARRGDSRLLCLDGRTGATADREFRDLPELLRAGDLLVLNDTRVIPARLYGRKATGGRIEILAERLLAGDRMLAQIRASKPPRPGGVLRIADGVEFSVLARHGEFYEIKIHGARSILEILEAYGHTPLPPYIRRADEQLDQDRYQTVYARAPGAVAAPTAGLHFTEELLETLRGRGVRVTYVTLHVGLGTFQPVRVDDIREHRMHSEPVRVSPEACAEVERTHAAGCRVIAVGTTAVRSLETAALTGRLEPYAGETDLFIYPGFRFQVVDALITNFHLPESTLLMLVCAFAGRDNVLRAYAHASAHAYRFYSYGDAMFIDGRMPPG